MKGECERKKHSCGSKLIPHPKTFVMVRPSVDSAIRFFFTEELSMNG